jgi:enoyl-CoA hydratase
LNSTHQFKFISIFSDLYSALRLPFANPNDTLQANRRSDARRKNVISTTPQGEDDVVHLSPVHTHVAIVTLNRPAAMNAISPEMAIRLGEIVALTEADPAIRAVILTGAGGKAFCAGADLKSVSAGGANSLWTVDGGFAGFVGATRAKPWIAAVNGFALAGGFEIALAADMIVAADHASFGLPEVSRGLIAAAGGLFRLPRAIPRAIALELIATGARITAARGYQLGLVNRVVPANDVMAEAHALAAQICANAPIAARESLQIARMATDLDETDLVRLSAEARARIMLTEDYREGPRAFVEKRPPNWTGR